MPDIPTKIVGVLSQTRKAREVSGRILSTLTVDTGNDHNYNKITEKLPEKKVLTMLCSNIGVNERGHLTFAGADTVQLASHYKTPLYLMDEDRIRENCRIYQAAMKRAFGPSSFPLYASKAASFKHIYEIMQQEDMAIDVVSAGEIATAKRAGFSMERAFFHGNCKTDADISYAMAAGVGYFVADHEEELLAIDREAESRGIRQKVLLRLTPGIDPHTYEAVATGKVDSKFGVAIETGQAEAFVRLALSLPNVRLMGYHCHVGSQVFDEDGTVYHDAAKIMLTFAADMKARFGANMQMLNLGGGYGVRYTEDDPTVDIAANIEKLAQTIDALCTELKLEKPAILLEPGRSIVADAGMTLYTAGSTKSIPGYKNYVPVDGGMTDNPRYALYAAHYTLYVANRADEKRTFRCDVVGRCCESGDIIQPSVLLPKPKRGDLIAVCTTGAYNYSMASNYNRIPRPPVVMLRGGQPYLAVRRETMDDLTALDV